MVGDKDLYFGQTKTKVTINGSKYDMQYYTNIVLWSLYGQKLVSGSDEEIKNIDKNVVSARKTIFNLLGQTLSYRCKLSPLV